MDDTGPYKAAYNTYLAGLAHDPDNEDLTDGLRRALDAFGKSPQGVGKKEEAERAMADPEIRAIMSDPVI
jgi:stress-induced-phosphoprotein 1